MNEKKKVGRPTKETKKKYGFVQLELDTYNELLEYCGTNGLKIGLFASRAISQKIKTSTDVQQW
jgi:hypothetical protein